MILLKAMPPRPTILLMGSVHLGMALSWWLSSPVRSSGLALSPARSVGSVMSAGHPMWLWALGFTLISIPMLAGGIGNHRHICGYACLAGSALLFAYGICSGWAASQNPTVPITGLVVFTVLSVWHTLNATMLLGSSERRWG